MRGKTVVLALFVGSASLIPALTARAAAQGVEVGTSLVGASFGTDDDDSKVFGVPSSGFGLISPSVYASIFVGSNFAVEPQVGFIWASSGGEDVHFLNVAAQFDYFLTGITTGSPYVFVSVGAVDVSDSEDNPQTFAGGAGYRWRVGDRLTFRVDGRATHFTDGGGNAVSFGLSIGGLFGQ